MIESALPAGGPALEAGCGLGQYVVLLRRRGHVAFGVDWSLSGLRQAREFSPPAPVAAMDLGRLGFPAGTFAAYISLGVVEHDPRGPDEIVTEARRVLRPQGVLVISVPYLNGARRAGAWWIRRANAALARRGGSFYQYAYGRAEFRSRLDGLGFRVVSAWPYDPARIVRRWLRRRLGAGGSGQDAAPGPAATPGVVATPGAATTPAVRSGLGGLARSILYSRPVLALLGHMILFVAIRDDRL